MATVTSMPNITTSVNAQFTPYDPLRFVPVTIHAFPTLEPRSLESWSTKHLYLPLRRDILHLAVVFEGDATRQGTASSKTRWEIHGSHKKVHRQKGSGRARAGMKQAPNRKGGGKTFGPKPRDFSTKLNRKVYDLAWRTALSYRYRKGELVVCEDGMDLPLPDGFLAASRANKLNRELKHSFMAKCMRQVLGGLEWGKERTTFITGDRRSRLYTSLEYGNMDSYARALELDDVDVKDLLETGRMVVERSALKELIKQHQSDLVSNIRVNGLRANPGPIIGAPLVHIAT